MDETHGKEAVSPAVAYAAALREAVADFTAQGGTQRAIAQAVHVAPATLSRYLSGDRIAPREFLNALRAYLGEQGQPLETDLYKRLDALCGKAHAASGSPAVQLVQLKEELGRLRAEQEQAQQVAETRLAGLEEQADRLARDLEQALERAQSAEGARRLLEDRVREQDESLRHAQDYVRQMEAELTEQREQTHLLQREVGVLREQNRQLVKEQPRAVSGVSTHVTSMEAIVDQLPAGHSARMGTSRSPGQPVAPAWRPRNPYDRHPAERAGHDRPADAPKAFDPPPKRSRSGRQPSVTRSKAISDTVVMCLALVVTGALGTGLSAGFQAEPGLSIARLAVAVLAALLGAIACGITFVGLGDKYLLTAWRSVSEADRMLIGAVPLMLITAVALPFYLDTDLFGLWLADTAGLL